MLPQSQSPARLSGRARPLIFDRGFVLSITLLTLLLWTACGKPSGREAAAPAPAAASAPKSSLDEPPPPSTTLVLPLNLTRHTDDLDAMVKRSNIRALVIINPIGFFFDKGVPRGIIYEALDEFQKFTNKKLNTGALAVKVSFIPLRLNQLEAALNEGVGDFIAMAVVVTPDREKRVAFSAPLETNVTQIIVTGPEYAEVSSLEGLAGKPIYVNPLTTYYDNLLKVNESLKKDGKTPLEIKEADKNLDQDDLIQMVNAGLIPATVTTKQRAELWAGVLHDLKPHPEMVIASEGQLAWVMRKSNPQLKQLVDEFVENHAAGTSFGNTLVRRYLQNTKWITNSTSKTEMEKFQATVAIFQKYATEYNFDYLMLAAQGYQESMLDQDRKSRRGALGIMQVLPKYAAASPININDVRSADGNIHAGAKMLKNLADTYFNDPKLDSLNKTLFVFAGYNAGPNRIAQLRKQAADRGLDPNVWFDNVELVAAQDIGQETVTYVRNIYKYYVAYKLAIEQAQIRQKTKAAVPN